MLVPPPESGAVPHPASIVHAIQVAHPAVLAFMASVPFELRSPRVVPKRIASSLRNSGAMAWNDDSPRISGIGASEVGKLLPRVVQLLPTLLGRTDLRSRQGVGN